MGRDEGGEGPRRGERSRGAPTPSPSAAPPGHRCGVSCDFWNRFEHDIALTAAIGSNAIRISLEWSRCVPAPGAVDRGALARFHAIFDACDARGITPLVTLHHFVQPQWFDEAGGWDAPGGARHFLEWTRLAVTEFGPRIRSWCTFNEPGVLVSSGWGTGFFPPGRTLAVGAGGRALLGLLRAHTAATKLIKSLPAGRTAEVGIVHNIMPYAAAPVPFLAGWTPPWARAAAALGHRLWGNDTVVRYLETGEFEWAPLGAWGPGALAARDAKPPLDWVGLNFYGRVLLDPLLRPTAAPGEAVTDFRQGVWRQGFFDALVSISSLGVPVLVMETGLPDAGDAVRPIWAKEYMGAALDAVRAGVGASGKDAWGVGAHSKPRPVRPTPPPPPPPPLVRLARHDGVDPDRQLRVGVWPPPQIRPVQMGRRRPRPNAHAARIAAGRAARAGPAQARGGAGVGGERGGNRRGRQRAAGRVCDARGRRGRRRRRGRARRWCGARAAAGVRGARQAGRGRGAGAAVGACARVKRRRFFLGPGPALLRTESESCATPSPRGDPQKGNP